MTRTSKKPAEAPPMNAIPAVKTMPLDCFAKIFIGTWVSGWEIDIAEIVEAGEVKPIIELTRNDRHTQQFMLPEGLNFCSDHDARVYVGPKEITDRVNYLDNEISAMEGEIVRLLGPANEFMLRRRTR